MKIPTLKFEEPKNETEADTLAWLAGLFNEPVESVYSSTPRESIANWDSLGVLTLMAEIDEKFGITLSDQEMRVMTKVGDILSLLRSNGKL